MIYIYIWKLYFLFLLCVNFFFHRLQVYNNTSLTRYYIYIDPWTQLNSIEHCKVVSWVELSPVIKNFEIDPTQPTYRCASSLEIFLIPNSTRAHLYILT